MQTMTKRKPTVRKPRAHHPVGDYSTDQVLMPIVALFLLFAFVYVFIFGTR